MSSPTILRLPFSLAKLIYRSMTRTWQLFRDAKIQRHDQQDSKGN
ncbi:MAG: hypothetical protein WBM75_02030 [Polyangiales bacterium]